MSASIGALLPMECHAQQAADMRALITDLEEEGLRIPVTLCFSIPGDNEHARLLMDGMATRLSRRGYDIDFDDTGLMLRMTAAKGMVTYRVIHPHGSADCGVAA